MLSVPVSRPEADCEVTITKCLARISNLVVKYCITHEMMACNCLSVTVIISSFGHVFPKVGVLVNPPSQVARDQRSFVSAQAPNQPILVSSRYSVYV